MMLRIADVELEVDQAADVCRWYAGKHPGTLKFYDFAGTDTDPHPHDGVDLADAGRLVVINANLTADDVPRMISAATDAPWSVVRHDDDLLSDGWEELLSRAEELYWHFRQASLGPTRTHKLLHLKRPRVFPIVDSVVRKVYRDAARDAAGGRGFHYWPVVGREINANRKVYRELTGVLQGHRVGRLTVPRLHDILVWSLHGRRRGEARSVAGLHG